MKQLSRFKRGVAAAIVLTIGTTVLTLNGAGQAQASCSTLTDKAVGGTLAGDDGRAVNGVVGFTFVDEFGYRLDIRGCRLAGDAYGRVFHLNSYAGASGVTQTSATSNAFRVDRIPATVKEVWVETYPKAADGSTDYSHYTGVYEARVRPGTTNLAMHFPVTCSQGGRTGAIVVSLAVGGQPVTPSWIGYWSEGSVNHKVGYALASGGLGTFTSPPLATNPVTSTPELYQVVIDVNGRQVRRTDVPVYPCQTTSIAIAG